MRPQILVTNDDGITARGIRALVEVACEFGDVTVIAPDSPQSGQGHAITLESPLRLHSTEIFGELGAKAYECSGTPVDCVKLGKSIIARNRKFDLCLSGINHGSNASINILYSGTMSAAMEAAVEGINSIGFSLTSFKHDADFTAAKHVVRRLVASVLADGMQGTRLLNVNIPNLPLADIRGIRVSRQAKGHWTEEFLEGKDPSGKPYYWLAGNFICLDPSEETDIWALANGFVSVVPAMHDLTAYTALSPMKEQLNFMFEHTV
jgi:5'-nucleotidase